MKGAGITLICALTIAKGYVVDKNKYGCPLDATVEKLLEHENCNKFYQCFQGVLVEHKCPNDLLFNIDVFECDWPENVVCGDRLIPDSDEDSNGDVDGGAGSNGGNCDPSQAPAICAAEGSDGVLVANENCNKFYKCSEGVPVALLCPTNLLYNPITEQCDWPKNVECGDRVLPETEGGGDNENGGVGDNGGGGNGTCNCNPGEAPSLCAAPGSNGILVAHENCNQFYKCHNGLPVAMDCPENLHYNPYKEQCDWPENVDCGDRVIPECDDNGGGGGGGGDSEGGDNEGGDNGGGDSGGGGGNGTCNCNPGEAPSLCAAPGSNGILVGHENCNQFYKCYNGLPVAMDCPGNLHYNPYKEQCDWPENVDCGDRVIPECDDNGGGGNGDGGSGGGGGGDSGGGDNGGGDSGGGGGNGTCNCNPGEAPSLCAAPGSNGILVAHEYCNQFYKCFNGLPVAMDCPGNLNYNPYKEQCDWPENVDCGDRVIPECDDNGGGGNGDGGSGGGGGGDNGGGDNGGGDSGGGGNGTCNCNPGEAPSLCAAPGSNGILVAHENCNQFYKCYNGLPVAMDCPGNLHYNPYKEQCDWPENVDCGDRVIPECDDNGGGGGGGGDSGGGDNEGGDNGGGDSGGGGGNGTCNCNPGEAPSLCAAPGSNGILVAHENCNQFYMCHNGLPVAMDCPGNLHYNPYKEQCDWPENVDCGDRVIPECDDNGGEGNGDGGSGGGGGGDSGGGDNGGGDSGGGGGNGTCNCNPGEAPSLCAAPGSNGILVAHENCNQFYKCYNGLPVAMDCPGNLHYNPYKEQCDWPENVDCGDRVIPECDDNGGGGGGGGDSGGGDNEGGDNGGGDSGGGGGNGTCNCNPGEAPSLCAAPEANGILVAHENCNQFYKCFNGLPVAMDCPGNLHYNPYKEQCDWPENVDCGDRVIPECDDNGGGENGDGGSGGGGGGDSGGGDNGGGDSGSGGGNGTCNCNPGEAPSLCAAPGSNGILVAHENCNQFYKCYNGLPVAMDCPGNLHYNPYKEQCDWPENVDCGDRVIPECDDNGGGGGGGGDSGGGDNEGGDNGGGDSGGGGGNGTCNCNPGEAPSLCAAPGSNGILVAHENCNQFYKCHNGLPVAMDCPENLHYNPYKEQCDWPENVDCGDRVIPECDDNGGGGGGGGDSGGGGGGGGDIGGGDSGGGGGNGTCNCNPGEAPSLCAAPGSNGILVAHENCNQFYKCHNGVPVAMDCPGNLHYNPYKEQCDWPENVDCGDRVIPECDDNGGEGNGDGGSGGGGGGDSGGGDNGGGDSGGGGGGNGTCNCNPGEAPSLCAAPGSNGILVAHENCNQFYKCFNGLPVAMDCPGNLHYNPYKEQCDWPENVDCGDRVIPECDDNGGGGNGDGGSGGEGGGDSGGGDNGGGDSGSGGGNGTCNCNPGEAPSLCAAPGSNGILVAHENCNQFYKCYNGLPVAMDCPGNLHYNPYKEQCDWPENVDCGDRVIPECDDNGDGGGGGGDSGGGDNEGGDNGGGDSGGGGGNGTCNCNPGEAPSLCAAPGSNGILVAHENCNQFYKCYNGLPVAMDCPGNLHYNPYKEQCDWPENVDCGDRVIPECDDNGGGGGGGGDSGGGDNEGGDNGGGDSGGGGGNGTCNCNPGEAPSLCAAPGSNGILVAHENCNQFYKCYNGLPVAMDCPGNLHYNPYKEQCDWPENVDCGDRVIPECDDNGGGGNGDGGSGGGGGGDSGGGDNGGGDSGGGGGNGTCNCNPGEAPSLCAAPGSNGILVAHENCNQFYKCYNGVPVAMDCPGNLHYNPYKEQCDWPENVDCGDRVIPECDDNGDGGGGGGDSGGGDNGGGDSGGGGGNGTCNCNPGEAPSLCAAPGSNGILVAHENCNQFYKCYNGLPVAMDCPGNLHYNPYKEQCDWPENVDCGDRVIPECDDNGDGGGGGGDSGGGDNGGGDSGGGGGNGTCNCNPGEAPSLCAAPGSNGILVAHENCNQFYKCYNGLPVAMDCPGNLHYNPYKEQCDWPENVDCGDRVIPECDDNGDGGGGGGDSGGGDNGGGDSGGGGGNGTCNCNPGEAPSLCAAPGSNGILVAHENCNQFYKCYNGVPVAMDCPGNLHYNPYKEQCDWPENVDCGDRVIPECDDNGDGGGGGGDSGGGDNGGGDSGGGGGNATCNCNPGEAPSLCAAPGSNGILVAHENCNQFYKCYNGLPVAMDCPGNLHYNPYKEQCDWPENVDCGDRVIPECDDNGGGGNGDGGSGGGGGGDSGGGDNGGGDSGGGGGNGTCNCNPGEAPSLCAAPGSNGILVAHENCNQFYKCYNGVPVAMDCPGNLHYNPYKEQCDWPENVDCGDRVIPECDDNGDGGGGGGDSGGGDNGGGDSGGGGGNGTCNCNPGEAPSLCAAPGSNGILVAHENCNQFYKCYNGLPVAMDCPGNLHYNPYKEQCDWPENVDCGDRVIPECDDNGDGGGGGGDSGGGDNGGGDSGGGGGNGTCNCNPGEAPSLCAAPGSNGILVAHENCNQFYKCYNGLPVAMDCPGNLHYNPYKEQCDWPENVDCGDRVIPECDDNGDGGGGGGDSGGGDNGGGDSGGGGGNGTCNCNPGEAPSLCAAPGSNGILVAHENCNQFYKCYNGVPVAMDCPGNLHYNPYKEQCDWPENVDCGDRVIPECDDNGDGGGGGGDSGGGDNGGGDSGGGGGNGTCNCNPGEAPSLCAAPGSNGILVAHENCNQFYKCYNGLPVAMDCPGNLHYNPYKEQCDWPENVDCGDRVIPECDDNGDGGGGGGDSGGGDNEGGDNGGGDSGGGGGNGTCNCNPGEAPSLCAAPGSNGILVAHENCNQFYKCYNGLPVAMDCPGNLHYNPYKEQCDWPENVDCGDRVIPECDDNGGGGNGDGGSGGGGGGDNGGGDSGGGGNGTCNCNPGEAPSLCAAPGSNGILVAHENCNQFYKCYNGLPVAMDCPGNLHYNPYKEQCDWPENVDCGDRVIPECDDNGGGGNGDGGSGGGGGGDNGGGDSGGGGNGTCNCNPGEAPSLCAAPGSNGILVAHENCNQFYKCFDGLPVIMFCPDNLLYNSYREQCDWPESVKCGDRVIPDSNGNDDGSGDSEGGGNDTCNCNPIEAPSLCSASGSDGILVAHEYCNQFYKCSNGSPIVQNCPTNLLYDPYKEKCDWPENVTCGERIISDGDENGESCNNNCGNEDDTNIPVEVITICASESSDSIFIPHHNCNQFYICVQNKPVILTCPPNLLYQPETNQCEWPYNVDCGNRFVSREE